MSIDSRSDVLELSPKGRYLVLAAAFLGWMFAGMEMGTFPLIARSATIYFLGPDVPKGIIGNWFGWYICAFLMGAACGGLLFGWIGDRAGRVKAMGLSILCYSGVTGVSYFAQTPEQLLTLRFIASLGIGGMWPNGVSLASEAWSDVSRPMLAGLIGTAANVGIALMGVFSFSVNITPDHWNWVLLLGATPMVLGALVLWCVPESPAWLAQQGQAPVARRRAPISEVFRPPLLRLTLIGICLGAIPLFGGWGAANWIIPWADQVHGETDPSFKGLVVMAKSSGAILGSLMGGWIASLWGRRATYFVVSLASLLISGYIFRFLTPHDGSEFFAWIFMLGLVSTIFFGWLPLYLPELFPTRVRATGSGVTFNFGRILTAAGVLGAAALINHYQGDYAKVGTITSMVYGLGMVVILFAPDTTKERPVEEQDAAEDSS